MQNHPPSEYEDSDDIRLRTAAQSRRFDEAWFLRGVPLKRKTQKIGIFLLSSVMILFGAVLIQAAVSSVQEGRPSGVLFLLFASGPLLFGILGFRKLLWSIIDQRKP